MIPAQLFLIIWGGFTNMGKLNLKTLEDTEIFARESIDGLIKWMKALDNPKRFEILILLLNETKTFQKLMEETNLQKSALGNHLNILQNNSLIEKIYRGLYCITIDGEELISALTECYLQTKVREQARLEKIQKILHKISNPGEEIKMNQNTNNLSYIPKKMNILEGIDKLSWGTNKECTFIGALEIALKKMGETYDYIDLMGLSGMAFRFYFHHPEWCASSPDGALNLYPSNIMNAIGYKGIIYCINEIYNDQKINLIKKDEMISIIRKEIDEDRPVVAMDLISPPDWGVITGYVDEKLLCRTYYDKQENSIRVALEEIYDLKPITKGTMENYNIAENFPDEIFTLKKVKDISSYIKKVRDILKFEKNNIEKVQIPPYYNGIHGLTKWIEDLRNDEKYSKMDEKEYIQTWQLNFWIYNSLHDKRKSAYEFFMRIEKLKDWTDKELELIGEIKNHYEKIKNLLFDKWIYCPSPMALHKDENRIWIAGDRWINGIIWTKEMRIGQADALEKVCQIEKIIGNKLREFHSVSDK